MIFKIVGGGDYSANVIAGTYSVNPEDVYIEWTDANHIRNRVIIRERLKGSFDMFFKTVEEYQAFVNDVIRHKEDGKIQTQLVSNATGALKTINAFIEFGAVRGRNDSWQDTIDMFTVSIEEE